MNYFNNDDALSDRSEAWLSRETFWDMTHSRPMARAQAPRPREQLEWLAEISPRHAEELRRLRSAEAAARSDRELLHWAAQISSHAEEKLRALERDEAVVGGTADSIDVIVDQIGDRLSTWLDEWNEADHPRDKEGRFRLKQGGVAGGELPETGAQDQKIFRMTAFQQSQSGAVAAAPSGTWPKTGPTSSWLPKLGSGAAAGAGAAGSIGAGAFLGGLRNSSMGAFWSRIPGTQAMPQIWVYELEKRVRTGKLSREDAIGIFNTAVLGAEAQSFKPTGGTMSAVHKSATSFLASAEAVYFAKKKNTAHAGADQHAGNDAKATGADAPAKQVTGEELAGRRKEFDKLRPELWKEEARRNPEKYSHEQLQQMRAGKAPKDSEGKPLEIHHKKPLSEGGTNTYDNFQFGTRDDHRIGPNFKKNHPNLPRRRDK